MNKTAFRRKTVHTVSAALRLEFVLSDVGNLEHLLACPAAHCRLVNNPRCEFPDPPACHVASAQWRRNEYHASDFRPVTEKQFLAKIFARFRRQRYLIRRPAEDFHPKLISAVG